jgi:hypothetical protein
MAIFRKGLNPLQAAPQNADLRNTRIVDCRRAEGSSACDIVATWRRRYIAGGAAVDSFACTGGVKSMARVRDKQAFSTPLQALTHRQRLTWDARQGRQRRS